MTSLTQPQIEVASAPAIRPLPALLLTIQNALIITRREVRDSFRDWRIIGPIVVLTFFFPFLAQIFAQTVFRFFEGFGAELLGERTIPFMLMIVGFFPISISLVIALETFVGEKERRSLEPLLSTPLTNTELYIGKTLSSMIPPLVASIGGMLFYLATLVTGELAWRPQPALILQIILLTIVQANVMVTGAVVVSSQTTSTRAANLFASFIVLPMALIVYAESFIMFQAPDAESPNGIGALWMLILGMIVVAALLLRVGNSIFNREELLGRTVDRLNLAGILRRLWGWFRAVDAKGTPAANPVAWYTRALPYSLRKLGPSLIVTLLVFGVVFATGVFIGMQPEWRIPLPALETLSAASLDETLASLAPDSTLTIAMVFVQNMRVLILAGLVGMFTFGIGSLLLTPWTFLIAGYLFVQLAMNGYPLSLFLAALLPHGIVEIPIIVIATATMVRLGAIITRPPVGETVGQAWTIALGDSLKISVALILPGLLLAAVLEVLLTPQVLGAVLASLTG
jgi:uncharacterized membrane protein SpoIIM required for sporulation/ABC-type transport system involved in multi-copper enzyme maturation permease subunit